MTIKRTYHGVGYNSGGRHLVSVNRVLTHTYIIWYGMISRCYSKRTHLEHPNYAGCSVSENWQDFQRFAEWYESHEFSGLDYQLDKDLLVEGNKVYSAETCCLIPKELNSLIIQRPKSKSRYLIGAAPDKRSKSWRSRIGINGKLVCIGSFDTELSAHLAFVEKRKEYLLEMANKWKGRIEPRAFEALINRDM